MALIKCPECGKEVSDAASNCPNCGYPLRRATNDKMVKIRVCATGGGFDFGGRVCTIKDNAGNTLWKDMCDKDAVIEVDGSTKITITYEKEGSLGAFVKDMFVIQPIVAEITGGKKYQVRVSNKNVSNSAFLSGLTLGMHKTEIKAFLNEVDFFDTDR